MARIARSTHNGDLALEIRPWVPVSMEPRTYIYFNNGMTIADSLVWVEIGLTMADAPLYYAHHLWDTSSMTMVDFMGMWLEEYRQDVGFVKVSPEEAKADSLHQFQFDIALGPIYTHQGDFSSIRFCLSGITADQVSAFYADLKNEVEQVQKGFRPDPDSVPRPFAALPFSQTLNARAYDTIGEKYVDDYLQSEFYRAPFEEWLSNLPPRAKILDVGCGYGEPIACVLAERGYQVTGIDLSPKMIELARARVPAATFEIIAVQNFFARETFDGACAFNSLLHLDPIELRVALKRIYDALKPGGYFLIVSATPSAEGYLSPYDRFMEQPVWQWQTGLNDLRAAVQEHDLFSVVSASENREPCKLDEPDPSDLASESHWEEMRPALIENMRVQGNEDPEQAADGIIQLMQAGFGSFRRVAEKDSVSMIFTLLVEKK